jgi:hypothetical protein
MYIYSNGKKIPINGKENFLSLKSKENFLVDDTSESCPQWIFIFIFIVLALFTAWIIYRVMIKK